MVDFATFATTIDTLFPEGVTIDAQFSTINGEVVSSVEVPNDLQLEENAPAYQTIQVGVQQMDGKTLLNYAAIVRMMKVILVVRDVNRKCYLL